MSATRNPYYQLPGGAELPGDVRVSDTPDATKTAADGWAASPAAVAETQTYHKRTGHSAVSNVKLANDNIYVTGKNVDVYLGVVTSTTLNQTTVITGAPKPVASYALATFVNSNGVLQGFGWINASGNIFAPANLPAGTWYIIAHYTTH